MYGRRNDRYFDLLDLSTNVGRFLARGVKLIRRGFIEGKSETAETNLAVALVWVVATANRLHVDIGAAVWERFPRSCPYCGSCPCTCDTGKPPTIDLAGAPHSIHEVQDMFAVLYPASNRSLEHAALHLVEEHSELQEALLAYRARRGEPDLRHIRTEIADYVSCHLGVLNSMASNAAQTLARILGDGCTSCGSAPCVCDFDAVMDCQSKEP